MANSKAEKYRGKSAIKDIVAQQEGTDQRLDRMQKALVTFAQKLFSMEKELSSAKSTARVADWRSLAVQKLLAQVGITETQIVEKVLELQTAAFDEQSTRDDAERGLVDASEDAIAEGTVAILTVKFFEGEVEQSDLNIHRSKIEIGKEELLTGLDAGLIGARVGEARSITGNIDGRDLQARATVLGLRKKKQ